MLPDVIDLSDEDSSDDEMMAVVARRDAASTSLNRSSVVGAAGAGAGAGRVQAGRPSVNKVPAAADVSTAALAPAVPSPAFVDSDVGQVDDTQFGLLLDDFW